jgi:hypothetical protein
MKAAFLALLAAFVAAGPAAAGNSAVACRLAGMTWSQGHCCPLGQMWAAYGNGGGRCASAGDYGSLQGTMQVAPSNNGYGPLNGRIQLNSPYRQPPCRARHTC